MSNDVLLLGVSNAIVDILSHVEDSFIQSIDAPPGSMILIDANQASELYSKLGPSIEMSGGSVSNTIAGFAALGGKAAYIGRVAEDQFGEVFNHDMESLGVAMRLPPETRDAPTARSYVLITPDGQRTMQTHLGACTEISVSDIRPDTIGTPAFILLEGYIWDTPEGYAVTEKAIEIGRKHGAKIVLSLSDSFCVERHHDIFSELVKTKLDVVLGNIAEFKALLGHDTLPVMASALQSYGVLAAITQSEQGSTVVEADKLTTIDAAVVEKVVDTTGAGDAFSAGFLYGLSTGQSAPQSAALGSKCAAAVIEQVGARFQLNAS